MQKLSFVELVVFVGPPVRQKGSIFHHSASLIFSPIINNTFTCGWLSVFGLLAWKGAVLLTKKGTKTLPMRNKIEVNWSAMQNVFSVGRGEQDSGEFPLLSQPPVMLGPNPLSCFNVFFFFCFFLFIALLELLSRFVSHFLILCSSFYCHHILLLYLPSPSSSLGTHYLSMLLPEYSHPCLSALPHVFHFSSPPGLQLSSSVKPPLLQAKPAHFKRELPFLIEQVTVTTAGNVWPLHSPLLTPPMAPFHSLRKKLIKR